MRSRNVGRFQAIAVVAFVTTTLFVVGRSYIVTDRLNWEFSWSRHNVFYSKCGVIWIGRGTIGTEIEETGTYQTQYSDDPFELRVRWTTKADHPPSLTGPPKVKFLGFVCGLSANSLSGASHRFVSVSIISVGLISVILFAFAKWRNRRRKRRDTAFPLRAETN